LRALANPTGFRVVTALRKNGPQTTEALAATLRDVPTSSLYRQLARLRETGIIQVAGERKARGAIERTYALGDRHATVFDAKAVSASPVEIVRETVRNLASTLFAEITAFINNPRFRKIAPQMLAATFACDLTDDDYREAAAGMQRAIAAAKKRSSGAAHVKRRIFYVIALPEAHIQ